MLNKEYHIAKTKAFKDYDKGNPQRKILMQQGMPMVDKTLAKNGIVN